MPKKYMGEYTPELYRAYIASVLPNAEQKRAESQILAADINAQLEALLFRPKAAPIMVEEVTPEPEPLAVIDAIFVEAQRPGFVYKPMDDKYRCN